MKIALFQANTVWQDKSRNLKNLDRAALDAAKARADVLCLPEMFSTGFSMDAAALGEELKGSATLGAVQAIAKQNKIAIIGSMVEKDRGKFYNTAVVVDKTGKLISTYRKINLFPLAKEHKVYSAGTGAEAFGLGGVKCGVAICYDLRFPEVFRTLALKGAKVIFVPANWPASRTAHWLTLLQARAIEDQVFIAGVNRVGEDPKAHYHGNSIVFGPWGDEIAAARSNDEGLVFAELDFAKQDKIRKEYPFLQK